MPSDFSNVKLGPCSVTYGATLIDKTQGGVVLRVEPDIKDTLLDQYGSSPVDKRIKGWLVKVTVPMAETDMASLGDIAVFLKASGGALIDEKLGTSLRASAQPLTLHPLENAVSNLDDDLNVFLAVPSSAVELKYGFEDERIFAVDFVALPKTAADPGAAGNFFAFGDPSSVVGLNVVTFTAQTALLDPVEGTMITVVHHGSRRTNSAGEAIFYLPSGDYYYVAEKSGYNTAYSDITVAAIPLTETVTMTV